MNPEGEARRARTLAAGCLAGAGLMVAGTWLRFALTRTMRIDTHGWPFFAASAVSGTGIVAMGICSLRLAPLARALSWRALWGWALAVHALAAGALALTSSDVFSYLADGALVRAGLSPYTHGPSALGDSPLTALVEPRWADGPSPYGPLFHRLVAATAWAGEVTGAPLWGAFYACKLALVVALLAALALAARSLARSSPGSAKETWVGLALGPLFVWELSGQGHNDALVVLALVAFVASASASRPALAAAALASGVAVKLPVIPLLGLYLLVEARRSLARAAGLALAAGAVLLAVSEAEWARSTLRSALLVGGGTAGMHAHSLIDLVCLVLDGLGWDRASRIAFRVLSGASAALCAAALGHAAWTSRTLPELAHGYLLFLFALYLTAPWFQPWYVCWALPLLLAEPDPRWRRFVATFAVVTVAQWMVPLDPFTTVAANAWAASRLWRLARPPPAEPARAAA